MARENTSWGYGRIEGTLRNLGHTVSRSTIAWILKEHGITPVPTHRKGMSWSTLLKVRWDALGATDFFTVEVLTLHGLVRYHVLFVMSLANRAVEIAGIVPEPNGVWSQNSAALQVMLPEGLTRQIRAADSACYAAF